MDPDTVQAGPLPSPLRLLGVALSALVACAQVPATSGPLPAPVVWDSLTPGTTLKVHTGTRHLTGQLGRITPDSLFLGDSDSAGVGRIGIDTLWRRHPNKSSGAVAGLITGTLFAAALILTENPEGDDPGLQRNLGVTGGLTLVLLGAMSTSLAPDWDLLYVRRGP